MIKKIKADGVQEVEFLAKLGERSRNTNKDVTETVSEIINNVMMNGDKAVREYTIKFDGKAPDAFEVPKEELTALTADCDPEFIATLKKAADNIRNFHERQKQQSWLTTKDNGVIMGQRIRGLKRVGLYVPGGTAAYPSSVLMNAIPAKIAGVSELIMVTPPGKDGKPNPDIMAAAAIALWVVLRLLRLSHMVLNPFLRLIRLLALVIFSLLLQRNCSMEQLILI